MPAAREVCHRKLCLDVSGKGKLGGYMKKDKYCMNVGPLVVRSNGSADFNVAKPNRDLQGRYACLRHRTRVTFISWRKRSEYLHDMCGRLDGLHKEDLAGAKHRGVDSLVI